MESKFFFFFFSGFLRGSGGYYIVQKKGATHNCSATQEDTGWTKNSRSSLWGLILPLKTHMFVSNINGWVGCLKKASSKCSFRFSGGKNSVKNASLLRLWRSCPAYVNTSRPWVVLVDGGISRWRLTHHHLCVCHGPCSFLGGGNFK